MSAMSLRLPDDLEHRLNQEARIEDKPRSQIVREALSDFLQRRERERFMAEMVAEAKRAYSDPEIRRQALELTEEFLPLDNEALDIAEGYPPGEPAPEESDDRWWK